MRLAGGCSARIVDDIANAAVIVEARRDHVVKANLLAPGYLDGACQKNIRIGENTVDAQPPGLMLVYRAGHLVRGPAICIGCAAIGGLVRWVVWDLGLVHVSASTLAIPEHLELLVMLNQQTVSGDVIAIYHQAVLAEVVRPTDVGAVVGAPDPGVIDDRVIGIDFKIPDSFAHGSATLAKEHICQK